MSASQNTPTVKVTERELAVTLVGLYAEFMRTESAPFRNAQSDEDPEMATFM